MTSYFEIIKASAPHIYHSALILAPQESIVQKLYESYTHPFVRLVHGTPVSWDLNTVATTRPSEIILAVWSPCSRFVAITFYGIATVGVLDSVTFQQLQTLNPPQDVPNEYNALIFSLDSQILTCSTGEFEDEQFVVSWDLQTGGMVSTIRLPKQGNVEGASITYSTDGKVVGVFYWCFDDNKTADIFICDIASGLCMDSHSFNNNTPLLKTIWTYGESLQFTTADAMTVTIWEVRFISGSTPTKVETFPAPDGLDYVSEPQFLPTSCIFLPTPCLLALTFEDRLLVWDVRNTKCLLDCTDINFCDLKLFFSSNGGFFACSAINTIHLWKQSPTGYTLHRILQPKFVKYPKLVFSSDGDSIAVFYDRTIQLWHTNRFTAPPSSIVVQGPPNSQDFILDFSPDGALAVVAREDSNTAVVLNLKSGVPQLTISVDVSVHGLRVIGNTVVVIGYQGVWKVIAWDLPAGGCVSNAEAGLEDSSWITELEDMTIILGGSLENQSEVSGVSISPDSHYIALATQTITKESDWYLKHLCIHSVSTGKHLGHELRNYEHTRPWFTPDGHDVWCLADSGEVEVWRVGGEQNILEHLEHTVNLNHPPEGSPWASSQGYQVVDNQWVLGPDGKRLLMLPPPWQESYVVHRIWKGQFLALLHGGLSEPVILEAEP